MLIEHLKNKSNYYENKQHLKERKLNYKVCETRIGFFYENKCFEFINNFTKEITEDDPNYRNICNS